MEEILEAFWYYKTSNMYTALPCSVIKVVNGLNEQRVDVKPLINKLFKDDTSTEVPVILAVPVIFPASKTSAFTFPVAVGDTVLCVFSQRSMDTFKAGSGQASTPNDFRRFSNRDAVAIPGLFPFGQAVNNPSKRTLSHSTTDAVIVHNIGTANEAELRIKPTGKVEITSPLQVEVNAPSTVINAASNTVNGNVKVNGNVNATGDVVAGTVSLKTHVHSGVQTGAGNTGIPVG